MYTPPVRSKGSLSLAIVALLSFIAVFPLTAQPIDMNRVHAAEEFKWGINAYHNSLYGEAIRALERALAFTPEDPLIQEWLGKAYYQSGIEDTALSIWNNILESGSGTPLLRDLVDTVTARRGLNRELADESRYVTAFTLEGEREDYTLFLRPSSLFPERGGGYYLASWANSQVTQFSSNGAVRRRIFGGIQGLDHPFDVIEVPDRYLFITENLGDRVFRSNIEGNEIIRFGEKGTKEGQLIGPQYLAADDRGYIYVTETGNRRVSKFDYDGNFILSFGNRRGDFPGFVLPTGICVHHDMVYVADGRAKSVSVFDTSGNFIHSFGHDILAAPEGISPYGDGILLVADTTRVLAYDIESGRFDELWDPQIAGARITKAVVDANGDIVAADFTANTVTVLTDISNLYTGLFVQIRRVLSRNFPEVFVEVTVEDRIGNPYLGLDESNFILTELGRPVQDDVFIYPAEMERPSVTMLVDRSPGMQADGVELRKAAEEIYSRVTADDGKLALMTSGDLPAKEGTQDLGFQRFSIAAEEAGVYSEAWRFSLGLRMAVAEVVGWPGPRAVIFVTRGDPGDQDFADYPLDVLAAYMKNNDVAFYCIYTRPDPARPDELEYLVQSTGGRSAYLYQREGLRPLLSEINTRQTGRYFFRYVSTSDTEFGEKHLTLGAEAIYFKRSGRAESGYFAPGE